MNGLLNTLTFDSDDLLSRLEAMSPEQLDEVNFGIIGFDATGLVRRYNAHEAQMALFDREDVLGQHLFIELAPCLNNYLVASRFEDALATPEPLDEQLPYVLTFRMRPTRVRIRLLASPGVDMRYVLIQR